MKYDEAIAWLLGERSMMNETLTDPVETRLLRVAQADAAMTQQAYWIARARHEGVTYRPPLNPEAKRDGETEGPDAADDQAGRQGIRLDSLADAIAEYSGRDPRIEGPPR